MQLLKTAMVSSALLTALVLGTCPNLPAYAGGSKAQPALVTAPPDGADSPSSTYAGRHDRVRFACGTDKAILYIDHVHGIDSVLLDWPFDCHKSLYIHFKNFAMLEDFALQSGKQSIHTDLRRLQATPDGEPAISLIRARTGGSKSIIVIKVDARYLHSMPARQLRVSWIDAYR